MGVPHSAAVVRCSQQGLDSSQLFGKHTIFQFRFTVQSDGVDQSEFSSELSTPIRFRGDYDVGHTIMTLCADVLFPDELSTNKITRMDGSPCFPEELSSK